MKQFEVTELEDISTLNFANIFHVYDEPKLGVSYKTYNINRSLNFLELDNNSTETNSFFTPYRVTLGDSWSTISFKFYQTIELWWLVAKINNITNPTIDPPIGAVIKVLKSEMVNEILQAVRED